MPKFLDAPSWYDSNGNLISITGYMGVNVGSTAKIVPYLMNYSSMADIQAYVLGSTPSKGQVCCGSAMNSLTMTTGGNEGDVLTRTQSGVPGWKDRALSVIKIEVHNSATRWFQATAIFPKKYEVGKSFGQEELFNLFSSYLDTNQGSDDDFYLPAFGTIEWGGGEYLFPMVGIGAYPGTSSYKYIQSFYVRTNQTSYESITQKGFNYTDVEKAIVVACL